MADDAPSQPQAARGPILPWIEAARVVLMVGVVLVHANLYAVQEVKDWWPFGASTTLPLAILVPSFFLISGFVLGLSDVTAKTFDRARFIRRKLLTLGVPFLAWNLIMAVLDVGLGLQFMVDSASPGFAGQLALRLLTGYWQMYFISALLQCLVLVLLLRRHLRGRALTVIVVVAGCVAAAFYGLASWSLWSGVGEDGFVETYLNRTFAPWCFMFFLGLAGGRRPDARRLLARGWWVFALATLGAFLLYHSELSQVLARWPDGPLLQFLGTGFFFQSTGALAFVGFFAWLSGTRAGVVLVGLLARFGAISMGVYLCHNALLLVLASEWHRRGFSMEPAHVVPALWGVTVVFAALAAYAGRFLGPPGRILFAARPSLGTPASLTPAAPPV